VYDRDRSLVLQPANTRPTSFPKLAHFCGYGWFIWRTKMDLLSQDASTIIASIKAGGELWTFEDSWFVEAMASLVSEHQWAANFIAARNLWLSEAAA
jgi:hypothetical protein